MTLARTYWHDPAVDTDAPYEPGGPVNATPAPWWRRRRRPMTHRRAVDQAHANLVGSRTIDGRHLPAIDVDHPCRLVASRTEGHHHLYIDVPMAWWRYRLLLAAMTIAGVVQPGYYRASVRRRMTHLRLPPTPPIPDANDEDVPF